MLKEEVEEMKATLSCTEKGRARASAHSKHVVSQTQAAHGHSIKIHSVHLCLWGSKTIRQFLLCLSVCL